MIFPYAMGMLINTSVSESSGGGYINFLVGHGKWISNQLNQIGVILFSLLSLQAIFYFLANYYFAKVSEKTVADVRLILYSKLMTLPLVFYDKNRIGDVISRISVDVSLLQNTISHSLPALFREITILLLGIVILFYISPKLTLFMLTIYPVLGIFAIWFSHHIRKFSNETQSELANSNVIVEETLQSIHTVKAFTQEYNTIHHYKVLLERLVKIGIKNAKYQGGFTALIMFGLLGPIVAVIWYGALLVASSLMSIGDLLSFMLYALFMGGSIAGLGPVISEIQKTIGASKGVLRIIAEKSELPVQAFPYQKFQSSRAIEYKNITFSYPTREAATVLEDLSFQVKLGEKIALVGHSGAGKSTIVQLLMRFYELEQGEILMDGKSIKEYDLSILRQKIGIVPQEVILFGGSIRENIAYGRFNATKEEIIKAAREANALEFIEKLPEKFETKVGERGVNLSGGQRQRLAIARVILKDPEILILDEATSALDTESENYVQAALDKLMHNRTTFIIAHRMSTIRKADTIFVLENGKIIESGNHESLMQVRGAYYKLLKLQFVDCNAAQVLA